MFLFTSTAVQNASRGVFGTDKVKKGRCIELGSGVGLGGIAFVLLGCQDVTFTDKPDIVPLLQKNINNNISQCALSGKISPFTATMNSRSST